MKTTPLTLKEAALAWGQEKHIEVLCHLGWCRILKPGERGTKEEMNKCWTSFVFYDATYPDSGLKGFRLVENGEAIKNTGATMTIHATIAGNPCIVSMPDPGGQSRIRGRVWRWEYATGGFFALLRADGEPMSLSAYPGERHPLWRAVRRWERRNGKR